MRAWGGKFAKSREPRLFPVPHTRLCAAGTVRKASFPLAAPSHPPTLQSRLGKCWNETGIWMLTQRYQHVFCPGCFNSCFSSYSRISANEVSGSQTHPLAQRGVMKSRTQQFKTFLIPNQSPESLGAKDTTEEWAQFKTNLEFIINLGWFNLVALSLFRSWTLWGESFIFHWRGKVCYVAKCVMSVTCSVAYSRWSDKLQDFVLQKGSSCWEWGTVNGSPRASELLVPHCIFA